MIFSLIFLKKNFGLNFFYRKSYKIFFEQFLKKIYVLKNLNCLIQESFNNKKRVN